MVDRKGLRIIGFGFSLITVTVTFVAGVLVADFAQTETASIMVSATQ
jgi:hypothetical protein